MNWIVDVLPVPVPPTNNVGSFKRTHAAIFSNNLFIFASVCYGKEKDGACLKVCPVYANLVLT
jgi:hypothetical protein